MSLGAYYVESLCKNYLTLVVHLDFIFPDKYVLPDSILDLISDIIVLMETTDFCDIIGNIMYMLSSGIYIILFQIILRCKNHRHDVEVAIRP